MARLVKAYLAHPYSTMDWGFKFTDKLNAIGIQVIDPFDRPGQAELNKVETSNRTGNQVTGTVEFSAQQNKEIVEIDMIKVRQADIVIAVVDGTHGCPVCHVTDSKGTHMEVMGAAYFMRMPVFTLYTQPGRIHPWYGYLSRKIAKSEEELLEQLKIFMAQPVAKDWYL
jgi:nucleoside 2-deoxyribosyltransferase